MQQKHIAIIGGGHMGQAIARGLLNSGVDAKNLKISNPNLQKLQYLEQQYGLGISDDNSELADWADVIILAMKPNQVREACKDIYSIIEKQHPIIVCVAAGVTTRLLAQWLPEGELIVRCMPNTPAAVEAGVSALFTQHELSEIQRELIESLFRAVGVVVWVEEEQQIDIITALSGSGPAYIFYIMELMQKEAIKLGLNDAQAKLITSQMVLGAAKIALEDEHEFCELKSAVAASPRGTTVAALNELTKNNLEKTIRDAMQASFARAKEISAELGSE
jgi:pyrroline-5-carboxylate reductase